MLLVHLVSKIKIDALCDSVTVPSDSTLIAIKGFTDTGGIHLTKINLNIANLQKDLVLRIPFINLVQVELNVHQVSIHHFRPCALGDVDCNAHVVATRSKQPQEVGEARLILL